MYKSELNNILSSIDSAVFGTLLKTRLFDATELGEITNKIKDLVKSDRRLHLHSVDLLKMNSMEKQIQCKMSKEKLQLQFEDVYRGKFYDLSKNDKTSEYLYKDTYDAWLTYSICAQQNGLI